MSPRAQDTTLSGTDETYAMFKGIMEVICQPIAFTATADKKCFSKDRITKFSRDFTELDMNKVNRILKATLDSLVRKNTIKCKGKPYKFVSSNTKDDETSISLPKKQQLKCPAKSRDSEEPTPPKARGDAA
jgi:hypothetical protein